MNIYRQEMKMSYRSMLYWSMGMLLTLLFFMSMFPAISEETAFISQIASKFPPEVVRALGLSSLDLSTVMGFYGYVFMFILLIAATYALQSGISALSEEVRAKTTDFLISRPVTRSSIVTAKLMRVLTLAVMQIIIYIAGALVITRITANQYFDRSIFLQVNLSLFLLEFFFVGLGLLLSVVIKKIKTVLPIALGTVFGFWILQMLNQSLADDTLAYFTPFAYFDIPKIVATGSYEISYLLTDMVLTVVFTGLAYIIYERMDMPSV